MKDSSLKQKIKNNLIDFNNTVLKKMRSEAANIFSLEQGICSLELPGPFNFKLTFNENEQKGIKQEMIQKLKWVFAT